MFFKGMQNTFQSQLESPVFEGSKTKISFISQTSLLGHTFFILWFTDPPTLFFDEMEKK